MPLIPFFNRRGCVQWHFSPSLYVLGVLGWLASLAFQSSCDGFVLLIDAIVNQVALSLADHFAHLDMVHAAIRSHEDQYQLLLSYLCPVCCL